MTGVFHELDGPVRSSLKALMKQHPREVWAGISRLLLGNDYLKRHRIESLVGIEQDNHLGPGFLYAIPEDFYLEWTRNDPAHRAYLVMKWLPIAMKGEGSSLSWHTALESFILEFGDEEKVLEVLSSRLHPGSYHGSLAPYLDPQVKLMESWSTHPRSEVRKWARDRINWIKTQVQ